MLNTNLAEAKMTTSRFSYNQRTHIDQEKGPCSLTRYYHVWLTLLIFCLQLLMFGSSHAFAQGKLTVAIQPKTYL